MALQRQTCPVKRGETCRLQNRTHGRIAVRDSEVCTAGCKMFPEITCPPGHGSSGMPWRDPSRLAIPARPMFAEILVRRPHFHKALRLERESSIEWPRPRTGLARRARQERGGVLVLVCLCFRFLVMGGGSSRADKSATPPAPRHRSSISTSLHGASPLNIGTGGSAEECAIMGTLRCSITALQRGRCEVSACRGLRPPESRASSSRRHQNSSASRLKLDSSRANAGSPLQAQTSSRTCARPSRQQPRTPAPPPRPGCPGPPGLGRSAGTLGRWNTRVPGMVRRPMGSNPGRPRAQLGRNQATILVDSG